MSLLTPIAKVYCTYTLLPLEGTQAIDDTSTARNKDTKAKKQKTTSTGRCKRKSKAPSTDDSKSVCSNPSVSTTASSVRSSTLNAVEFFRVEAWGRYVKAYINDLKTLWAQEPVAVQMILEGAAAVRLSNRIGQPMGDDFKESLFINYILSTSNTE